MLYRIVVSLCIVSIGFLFVFTGCDMLYSNSDGTDESDKTAKLAYAPWAEGIAYTNVAKIVLEQEMGYAVTLTEVDPAGGFAGIADGDQDAFMEVWPGLHQNYIDQYGSSISDLGKVYQGAQSGLVVPKYVYDAGVTSISDLTSDTAVQNFSGEITGIDAGSGIMRTIDDGTENDVMSVYGLDTAGYELVEGSGQSMTSALESVIGSQEWIVATAWKPHWIWAKWDLVFLQQDKQVFWSAGDIHIYGREGLSTDDSELAQFLQNMSFTDEDLSALMLQIQESSSDVATVAEQWVLDNAALVDSWVP